MYCFLYAVLWLWNGPHRPMCWNIRDPSWWCYSGILGARALLGAVGHWGGFWWDIVQPHFLSVFYFWTSAMRSATLYTCSHAFACCDRLCPLKLYTQINPTSLKLPFVRYCYYSNEKGNQHIDCIICLSSPSSNKPKFTEKSLSSQSSLIRTGPKPCSQDA